MQAARDEPLAKATEGGLVGHGFVRIELEELLEAQPVVDLGFGLRVAQPVEVLENHHAQQHANTRGGASDWAAGGGDACLGLGEIHFAGNGVEHLVAHAALLHGQVKAGRLFAAFGLHGVQSFSPRSLFKRLLQRFPKGLWRTSRTSKCRLP